MKTYKELNEKIDRQYTSDYTLSKSGRKVHRTPLVDKDAEKVNESDTKQEHDLGYAHASQGKKSNPYNPGSPAHSAYESGHETYKRHFGEETMTIDEQINEVLSKDATAGDWIHDFVHSDNPKFEGKSKDKRKQMALAAYYAKQQNEEVELEEGDLSVRHLYNKFADAHVGGNDTKPTEKAIKKVHGDKVFAHMKKAANANAKGDMDGEERHFDNAQNAARKTDRIGGTVGRGRSEFMRKRREWSEEVELEEGYYEKPASAYRRKGDEIGGGSSYAPVAPVPDKKYIKGTPEHKAYKATKKPINGMPTNVKEGSMKSFKEMLETINEVNQKTVALAKEIAKKHKNMTSDVNRGNVHIFNKHDDEAADRLVLAHTGTDKEGNDRFHLHRVHSSAEDSDHRNLTAAEVHKHAARHITGKSMDEEVEQIEEKSEQAKRNKTMKNMMDASRGARYKVQNKVSADDVRNWDGKHPTPRAQNVAIGRALRNEEKKDDVPFDGPYTKTPGTVKDKSGAVHTPMSRAKHLARQAMQKKMKEDIDLFFEAKDESEYGYEGDMAISQLKTICRHAEEFMGMLKPDTDLPEWVQSKITLATDYIQTAHDYMSSEMNEELKGNQHKLDKNKNGKVDSGDLKMLRGEECPECHKAPCECGHMKEETDVETRTLSFGDFMNQLNEYNPGPGGVTRVQGRSYGAQYRDPEGEDDADDKKKQVAKSEPAVKRGRGRPAGSKSGANQKVTTGRKGSGVDYTGYKLHLPNSNR